MDIFVVLRRDLELQAAKIDINWIDRPGQTEYCIRDRNAEELNLSLRLHPEMKIIYKPNRDHNPSMIKHDNSLFVIIINNRNEPLVSRIIYANHSLKYTLI